MALDLGGRGHRPGFLLGSVRPLTSVGTLLSLPSAPHACPQSPGQLTVRPSSSHVTAPL